MILNFDKNFKSYLILDNSIRQEVNKYKSNFIDTDILSDIKSKVDSIVNKSILHDDIGFFISLDSKDSILISVSPKTNTGRWLARAYDFYHSMINEPSLEYLTTRYNDEVGQWVNDQIKKMIEEIDDPCTDNFRVAELGTPYEFHVYKYIENEGCCGFEDREITHEPSGRVFKIGCNYGH